MNNGYGGRLWNREPSTRRGILQVLFFWTKSPVIRHPRIQRCTRFTHALYAHYYIGFKPSKVANIFNKGRTTIRNWIKRFEETGGVKRVYGEPEKRKYNASMREWIYNFDEIKMAFGHEWNCNTSLATVWRIMNEYGLSQKKLEL
ncbi:hypothetical protein BC829DRAFT_414684 [Chytridium lagenaria]|nr:hypothetical protein BC829DRAFT_414684 [Chytridium lagenaria]